ncbi:type II toxin-antitoxin system VapC family toxin [Microbacterium bovistercoris]|uniref:Ribonuclease VapC n=1 Tax=Microbacterium bovistercoris TaxID=2293570 RepID=A0A371NV18_9MICO|nr:PIN domain-containing protein [Microbacterium bovistercoris]REJ06394.1 type II toxin-antitoxin system VapC family toxin [Microbacterium bovistercoris]
MPISADLLLDTSAAIALLDEDHPAHGAITDICTGATLRLSGHALVETYSVLTRLPRPDRVSAAEAARAITVEFPGSVALPAEAALTAVSEFEASGIAAGAVYGGLVGLAAKHAGITLLTHDRRALATYAALGGRPPDLKPATRRQRSTGTAIQRLAHTLGRTGEPAVFHVRPTCLPEHMTISSRKRNVDDRAA